MSQEQLREFMEITAHLSVEQEPIMLTEAIEKIMIESPQPLPTGPSLSIEKLNDLIFKLKSYQDNDVGEYAAGIEAGMSKAAELLENLINREQEEQ